MVEKTFKALVLALVLTLMTACIIVVHEDEDDVEATWVGNYSPTAEDESLAQHIGDAFDADATLDAENLRVSVRRGVATLRGEVSEVAALERAVEVAASVEGVTRVVSKLTVDISSG